MGATYEAAGVSLAKADAVVSRLRGRHKDMGAFTRREFRDWTRLHWLTSTRAGAAAACGAGLAPITTASARSCDRLATRRRVSIRSSASSFPAGPLEIPNIRQMPFMPRGSLALPISIVTSPIISTNENIRRLSLRVG